LAIFSSASSGKRGTPIQRRFAILLTLCIAIDMAGAAAQSGAPRLNPSLQKMDLIVGHWTYTGEYKPGPLGPGSKIVGDYDFHTVLNGFVVEGHTTERAGDATVHFLEIDRYDPTTQSILTNLYADDGTHYSGSITVSGRTATWMVKFLAADKEYQLRQSFTASNDGKTAREYGEISADGKTWLPFFVASCTRVKSKTVR
jgi:hypothetical protein